MGEVEEDYVFKNANVKKIEVECEPFKVEEIQDKLKCEYSATCKEENQTKQSNQLFEKFESNIFTSKDNANDSNSTKVLMKDSTDDTNNDKKYFLRKRKVEKIRNKNEPKIQKNTRNVFKVASRQEINKTEIRNERFQMNVIFSENDVNSSKVAKITIEGPEKSTLDSSCLTKNDVTSKKLKNERRESDLKKLNAVEESSVKIGIYKTEASVKDELLVTVYDSQEKTEIKDERLDGENNMPLNFDTLKSDVLQEVSTEKKVQESKIKLPDIKTKRKKPKFLCPIKKKKESDDMERVDIKLNDKENSSAKNCDSKQNTEFKIDNSKTKQISQERETNGIIERKNMSDVKKTPSAKLSEALKCKQENEKNCNDSNDYSFSDIFEVKIPLIGKKVIENDEKPFLLRYDLAIEKNKKRFRFMKQTGEFHLDNEILKPWEIEANKSEKEKKNDADKKKRRNIRMAIYVTKISMEILQRLNNDNINEKQIAKLFIKFLLAPVTPISLLYVPHFIHTLSFCRGCKSFSKHFRLIVNECYKKCHAMFPVPLGCNFETVYSAEVQKFLPDPFDRLEDTPLDYGDISDISESSDEENCF